MKKDKGRWSKQTITSFSGRYNDCEPQFSPDGKRLYFCSTRPFEGDGEPKDYDIWYVERTDNGWGEPVNPGPPINTEKNEFYPSITKDGTVYFTSHDMNIYRSKCIDGKYSIPEKLSDKVNTRIGEYNSYISPDESYLIFSSKRPGGYGGFDLYASYRKSDGSWIEPQNLGSEINHKYHERFPGISTDGKYLFFTRPNGENNGDIFWVSAKIIEELKPEELK